MYIHIDKHIDIFVYAVSTEMCVCICMYFYVCVCIYAYAIVHMCLCMYTRTPISMSKYVRAYVHVDIFIYIYIYIYTYVLIYIHTSIRAGHVQIAALLYPLLQTPACKLKEHPLLQPRMRGLGLAMGPPLRRSSRGLDHNQNCTGACPGCFHGLVAVPFMSGAPAL